MSFSTEIIFFDGFPKILKKKNFRENDLVVNDQLIPAGTNVSPIMAEILKGDMSIEHDSKT